MTRYALLKARQFSGNLQAWHAHVAESGETVLKAFDFTADFHSRDLNGVHSKGKIINLGVFGEGFHRLESMDIDSFSVTFAQDLKGNVEHFETKAWRSGIYDQARREGNNFMSSRAGLDRTERGQATSAQLDRPCWQVPQNLLQAVIDRLNVAEDEEVVFEECIIRKRKKAKEGSE
jgi:hypothetical protein